ncbi:hypothetical protein [Alteromonas gilva]|uniref:Uncharacterized protein n=1 Tax=Alteromonas gilva TaxID=2987522 RepID=A0ABT5L4N7_9ALTE|nr:hypothetical protein [Alteromonas gilva]MDC8831823.1 hypothetical protein [Alteromonas gilva]
MITFAIFAALVVLLVFFGFKIQNLQKQLLISENNLRANTRRMNHASGSMVVLSQQIQSFLLERLESSHKRGLISNKPFEVLHPMFEKISAVAVYCMDRGMSVEEALKTALKDSEVTLEQLREIVKEQPSDIRMAWSKNTLDGFIVACKGLSFPPTKTESTSAS